MFSATVSELNSAPSWNSTPQRASNRAGARSMSLACLAEDLDRSRPRAAIRPTIVRSSTDLPAPGTADDAEHLAAADIEVEVVVKCVAAESQLTAADPDRRTSPSSVGPVSDAADMRDDRIENAASSTITRKINSTTERVVSRPTLSALRVTCRPS